MLLSKVNDLLHHPVKAWYVHCLQVRESWVVGNKLLLTVKAEK